MKNDNNFKNTKFLAIKSFCDLYSLKLSLEEFKDKTSEAITLSNECGINIYQFKDDNFGTINQYHTHVLGEVFKKTIACFS